MRISDWSSDVCSSDLVMAGYLGRSPAAARYPPMAWIPIAAIPLGSSRAPSAPHILVELREIRRPALGEGGESLLGLGARQPRRKFPAFAVHLIGYRKRRSEEHTSELQSLMRISYAVFCLKKKNNK